MEKAVAFDTWFRQAVSAIDAGNEEALKQILDAHPELVKERLYLPGEWLTNTIGNALKDFYKDPYLLWFVSEDAVRNNRLPANIAKIAGLIIQKIKQEQAASLREQLDYTLRLVAWSWVARDCGVQIALLDVLIEAGADYSNVANDALVNGNFDAARHLIERGATITLPAALCLGKWEEADRLALTATAGQKQFGLILTALNGQAKAVSRVIDYGVDINIPCGQLYSHATALHHAVSSGSLETVAVLVEAGARFDIRDTIYGGTPLGWAQYGKHAAIAAYLQEKGAV